MARVTLSDQALRDALPAWSLAPPLSIARLPGGYTADVWMVTTSHTRLIAKYAYDAQAVFERGLRAAELLEQHGMRSGGPVRTRDGALSLRVLGPHGRAEPLALLQFVAGPPLDWQAKQAPALIGQHLARSHTVLYEAAPAGAQHCDDMLGYVRERTAEVAAHPGLQVLIDEASTSVVRFEARVPVTYGGVYGDAMEFLYHPQRDELALIDWGAFRWGPLLIDLAIVAKRFRALTPDWHARIQQFYAAYLPQSPIRTAELEGVPVYAAMQAAQSAKYFAWRLAHDVTLGNDDPQGNQRSLAEARDELERWLTALAK